MRNFIIGLIIGVLISIASLAGASGVRLIMIPDTIQGYNTLDLLNYLASLKARDTNYQNYQQQTPAQIITPITIPAPKKTQAQLMKEYEQARARPICSTASTFLADCLQNLRKYNNDENAWIQGQQ